VTRVSPRSKKIALALATILPLGGVGSWKDLALLTGKTLGFSLVWGVYPYPPREGISRRKLHFPWGS
jgi:hypothetical protein